MTEPLHSLVAYRKFNPNKYALKRVLNLAKKKGMLKGIKFCQRFDSNLSNYFFQMALQLCEIS